MNFFTCFPLNKVHSGMISTNSLGKNGQFDWKNDISCIQNDHVADSMMIVILLILQHFKVSNEWCFRCNVLLSFLNMKKR